MDSVLRPDVDYLKSLVASGLDGIASAKGELDGPVFTPPLKSTVWPAVAIGATVGALGTRLGGNRRAPSLAIGGIVGSLVGFVAALAWTSRRFTGCATRRALRQVNATRDAHWLETHPINYA